MNKPEIFDFHDYREFLKLWMDYRKAIQSTFSLRNLARWSGVSVSNLSMIIKGERSLSTSNLEKLAPHLKLNQEEISYLEALVLVCDGKTHDQRTQGLRRLRRFDKYRQKHHYEAEAFSYLQKWYNVVIRELSECDDFKFNPRWIKQRLRRSVDTWQIRQSLNFLKDSGFIEENRFSGKLHSSGKAIRCDKGIYKVSLREFHQQMLEFAAQSIDELSSSERLIMGYTAAMGRADYEKAQRVLEQCILDLEEIKANSTANGDKEVFHFMVSGIPMTKKGGDSE